MSSRDDSTFDGPQDNRTPPDEERAFEDALREVGKTLRKQEAAQERLESREDFLAWSRAQKKQIVTTPWVRTVRIAAAAAVLCVVYLNILFSSKERESEPTPEQHASQSTPATEPILSPMPGTIGALEIAIKKDKESIALASAANEDRAKVDEARSALSLREDVLLRGLDAVPRLKDTLQNAQSSLARAEAAGLLALLRHTEAAADIYDAILRVIDDRGPDLEPLLHATWRMLLMLEEAPPWALELGKEVSSLVRDPGPIRRAFGLRILNLIEEKTDASYGDVAMAVLRDDPSGEDLLSLFSLVTDDDKAVRSDELISICKELLATHIEDSEALKSVCRFVQSASRFADYSELAENLDAIASDPAFSIPDRRSAAAAISSIRGAESVLGDVYAEYGLQDN